MFARSVLPVLAVALLALPSELAAQQPSPLQLERSGRLPEASRAYMDSLAGEPADVSYLLGLERVLQRLDQLERIRPFVTAAIEASPRNQTIRQVQFRVAAALDGADSVAVVAAQWTMVDPTSEGPYRAWSQWLAQQGNVEGARAVIAQGRVRLGERRLSQFAAQYAGLAGDWSAAGREWTNAVSANPSVIVQASNSLRRAPEDRRETLVRELTESDRPEGAWIAAFLLASWDRSGEGWTLLDAALPSENALAAMLLRRFAERAEEMGTAEALRARGYALERLAATS
ncbi:MAG: hypothetical protein PVH40_04715, partial [Gemmatimonadales bacterium]